MGKVDREQLERLGFKPGLSCVVSESGAITGPDIVGDTNPKAVLYVAVLDNGDVLKVGKSETQSLLSRWKGILRVAGFKTEQYESHKKPTEVVDGIQIKNYAKGHEFVVWYKEAENFRLPSEGLSELLPPFHAEEAYLDARFEPLFGKPLVLRSDVSRRAWQERRKSARIEGSELGLKKGRK